MSAAEIAEIKKSLESLKTSMQSIEKKLDSAFKDLKEQVEKDVDGVKKELNKIETKVNDLVGSYDDMIETQSRQYNLRIDKVPVRENENLNTVVENIKAVIGLKVGDPRTHQYRLKTGRSKDTIIVQFNNVNEKELFFRNYLKVAATLTVKKLFPNARDKEQRIFVSHDLCLNQYQLNREANKKRRGGHVKEVRIKNGFVMVKISEDSFFERMFTIEMLEDEIKRDAEDQERNRKQRVNKNSNNTNNNTRKESRK